MVNLEFGGSNKTTIEESDVDHKEEKNRVLNLKYMKINGSALKFYRERIDLSQSELAREIGVSPQAVHSWENEIHKPTNEHFDKLLDVLDVKRLDLITKSHNLEKQNQEFKGFSYLTNNWNKFRRIRRKLQGLGWDDKLIDEFNQFLLWLLR